MVKQKDCPNCDDGLLFRGDGELRYDPCPVCGWEEDGAKALSWDNVIVIPSRLGGSATFFPQPHTIIASRN